jgi:hypothetical protein
MKAKTVKIFTRDSMVRRVSRKMAALAKPAKAQTPTADKKPVDLNEIHRRFWARLAGKE